MRWARTKLKLRQRRGDDSGSTLIEAAFVMPIFILVVFGIFEFSGYTMAKTSVGASVKAGARMATVSGSASLADREILQRMNREGAGMSQDKIVKIIIWNAQKVGEDPPANCQIASRNYQDSSGFVTKYGSCNTYTDPQTVAFVMAAKPTMGTGDVYGAPFAEYYFGCKGLTDPEAGHKLDCGWPPSARRDLVPSPVRSPVCPTTLPTRVQVAAGAGSEACLDTDLVGIYVETIHNYYTSFFGQQVTVKAKTTAAIEPQGYDK